VKEPPPKRRGAGAGAPKANGSAPYNLRSGLVKRLLAALEPMPMHRRLANNEEVT
jgi:hypothetical protein